MTIKGVTFKGQAAYAPALATDHMTRFTVAPETLKYRGVPKEGFKWLQVDGTYQRQIAKRILLLEEYGDVLIDRLGQNDIDAHTIQTTPDKIKTAEVEVRDAVVSTLLKDYPTYFQQNGSEIYSPVSGIAVDLDQADPLVACAALAVEDILLMMPCEVEPTRNLTTYRLGAGALVFPNDWSLRSQYTGDDADKKTESLRLAKLGKSVREIHDPKIKHYMNNFADHVDKGFHSMKANASLKCPYAAQLELDAAQKTGDAIDSGMNKLKEGMFLLRSGWSPQLTNQLMLHSDFPEPEKPDMTTENWLNKGFIRMEHQTLTKLPVSGAVVFTIKTYNWNMKDVLENDTAREALIVGNDNLSDEMVEYRQGTIPSFRTLLNGYRR